MKWTVYEVQEWTEARMYMYEGVEAATAEEAREAIGGMDPQDHGVYGEPGGGESGYAVRAMDEQYDPDAWAEAEDDRSGQPWVACSNCGGRHPANNLSASSKPHWRCKGGLGG